MEDAQNDPVKKAGVIRDIVGSIAKIPDSIQQELYVRETARTMDISEEVLFSTLAQMSSKQERQRNPQKKRQMELVKQDPVAKTKVDELYELERTIIGLLLHYGMMEEEFEDMVLKQDDSGELVLEPQVQMARVFEKVFLDLQEDEIAFANAHFQKVYQQLITRFNQKGEYSLDTFINELSPEDASEITGILMDEEQYVLHDWDRVNIYVKDKKAGVGRLVNETILALRRYLVAKKIGELNEQLKSSQPPQASSILQEVMDYISLKKVLSGKLNRVM